MTIPPRTRALRITSALRCGMRSCRACTSKGYLTVHPPNLPCPIPCTQWCTAPIRGSCPGTPARVICAGCAQELGILRSIMRPKPPAGRTCWCRTTRCLAVWRVRIARSRWCATQGFCAPRAAFYTRFTSRTRLTSYGIPSLPRENTAASGTPLPPKRSHARRIPTRKLIPKPNPLNCAQRDVICVKHNIIAPKIGYILDLWRIPFTG